MNNDLIKLIQTCKCGVYLTVNPHRDSYETVEQYFNSNPINQENLIDIDKDVYDMMKKLNMIIELQFYPHTPIGSYTIFHYDIDMILNEALSILT